MYVDDNGKMTGKYKPHHKKLNLDKKPQKIDESKEKPNYCKE